MKLRKLSFIASLAGMLVVPTSSLAALGGVTNAVGGATQGVSQTVAAPASTAGSLVTANAAVSNNSVNVNPAVCVNAATTGNCTATAKQAVSSGNTTVGGGSGNSASLLGVNLAVSGNSVNLNPAVCANVLTTGNCTATAVQTVTTGNTTVGTTPPGVGGGVIQAIGQGAAGAVQAANSLPHTGMDMLMFLLTFGVSLAAGVASYAKQRFQTQLV